VERERTSGFKRQTRYTIPVILSLNGDKDNSLKFRLRVEIQHCSLATTRDLSRKIISLLEDEDNGSSMKLEEKLRQQSIIHHKETIESISIVISPIQCLLLMSSDTKLTLRIITTQKEVYLCGTIA
jgi:hypothetical protein